MRDLFDLQGRVAVITGGSGGIGEGVAQALGQAGAAVVITARSEKGLVRASKSLELAGIESRYWCLDVTDSCAVGRFAEHLQREYGRLDILVNSAGINAKGPALSLPESAWDRVLGTNLTGYFRVAQALVPLMARGGWGKVVNISSIYGSVAIRHQSAYAASKGGVNQLTRVLAIEWAEHGITVNALAPGYIEVPRTVAAYSGTSKYQDVIDRAPLRRWGKPSDLAGPALFLSSPASDFMTGQVMLVDGGLTVW